MHALSIVIGLASWRLLYKTPEKAEEHFNFTTPDKTHEFNPTEWIQLIDDFGQRAKLRRDQISAVMLEDLNESKLGTIEYNIHSQLVQREFQKRAESDPRLRAPHVNSPSIISPMPGNGQWRG